MLTLPQPAPMPPISLDFRSVGVELLGRMGSTPQVSVLKGSSRPLISGSGIHRLHELFTLNAKSHPHHTAFIYEDIRGNLRKTTYEEAETVSNKLARAIVETVSGDTAKFKANSDGDFLVAVALPPSDELVLTLLAIWKAGAAYLPLDVLPRDRTKHILNESQPILIITHSGNEADTAFGNIKALPYEGLLAMSGAHCGSSLSTEETLKSSREDPIEMVFYTSGSSGLSKGVRVKKSSILNRLQWQWYDVPYLPQETTFVFKTALTFIDSVPEIWGPILCPMEGLRSLLIVPKEITTNPQRLVTMLNKNMNDKERVQSYLEWFERSSEVFSMDHVTWNVFLVKQGVRVKKSSILNRLQWQWYNVPYSHQETTFVFKTALTFMDSVPEIWGPVLCPMEGLRSLLIVPKEITTNPQRLVTMLSKYKIGRLVLVPSLLKAILLFIGLKAENVDLLTSLKIWICSGEALAPSLALQFFRTFRSGEHVLYNFYGSTEMMGDVAYHCMKAAEDVSIDNKVPIGVPLDNTAIYLLNKDLQPVRLGEVGELCAAGHNIAAGYVKGRDADRFVPNPLAVNPDYRILFRSGDFAKLVKGVLLFEGRADSQVKVRGHRVDLAEVETALMKCSEVQKGVVLCYNANEPDQQIVAFVELKDGHDVTPHVIEHKMKNGVPKYAVPQVIIVKEIPYLFSGKVDRQTLLKQYNNKSASFDLTGLNEGDLEAGECLFRTISEVLGSSARGQITKEANFFSLGGNSLNSVLTISLLNEQGYIISVTDFISAETLGDVVNRMSVTGDTNGTSKAHWDKFSLEILEEKHKEDSLRIIVDSFYKKSDLERIMDPPSEEREFIKMMMCLWPFFVDQKVSIGVRDVKTKKLMGVSLLMNSDEEPVNFCFDGQMCLNKDFLNYIEKPIRENVLPKGRFLHSWMLGTSQGNTPQENIEIMQYMEEMIIELAKDKGYLGIFTTNVSPLTQQIAEVLNYQKLKVYQVNEYVAPDGSRPFKRAADDQLAVVSWRKV